MPVLDVTHIDDDLRGTTLMYAAPSEKGTGGNARIALKSKTFTKLSGTV